MNSPALQNSAALAGRILLAVIFVLSGFSKIGDYAGTVGYMESMKVPGILLPLVILTELGGGLLVVAGYQTRLVALALAGFCIVSAVLFHTVPSDMPNQVNFMKNLAISGGFLMLFAYGAGAYSVDAMMGR